MLSPNLSESYHNKGNILYDIGEYEAALYEDNKAIEFKLAMLDYTTPKVIHYTKLEDTKKQLKRMTRQLS